AELRIKVTESIGVVPFVDAGTVYDSAYPDFSEPLRVGAGLGLRYYTDFGPLRVDVGVPLNPASGDARWQLYLSLGQAF
ncbi:MAG: BamA/TamA family outer membrane protein, partial [Alphaproteobacteria bacterium]